MLYLLDTNTLSEALKGNPRLLPRLSELADDTVAIPIVAWYEVIRGRVESLLKAANIEELLIAQSRFDKDFEDLADWDAFGVTPDAARHFEKFVKDKKRHKMKRDDLLIACIALAHKAVLVTRNVKDFTHVPGLTLQNWFE